MKKSILILFLVHLIGFTYAQDEFTYEVTRIYNPLSIAKEKVNNAQSFADLDRFYKSSWIREFISVEILTSVDGKKIKTISQNDVLSQEHIDIMNRADEGTDIVINMKYIPENNLTQNDQKDYNFSFVIDPENSAKYIGGSQPLKKYLKNTVDKIPEGVFEGYDLAAVKFTIDEEGQIIDPHVMWSSKDEKTDQLLLETISKMPCWNPAEYDNGKHVKQEFAFTVGNPKNCMMNLINLPQD